MRRLVGMTAAVVLAVGSALFAAGGAAADVPPVPVADFTAPLCPGQTTFDPTARPGTEPIPNLARVFAGPRLDDFNAGETVLLYDSLGMNPDTGGYPPVCATRYVAGVGAVSEWLFCTDLYSHTCGRSGSTGALVDEDGDPMPGLRDIGTTNPRLGPDPITRAEQEKIIAYLVRHGHPYDVIPTQSTSLLPDLSARADGTTDQRTALQDLIWCISDPNSGWAALEAVCDAVMDATEQQRILAMIPDVPVVELDLVSPTATLAVGDTATITLHTNLYNQPIALVSTGAAGTLSVLSGPATLGAGTITVTGTDPAVSTTVEIGVTATAAGDVMLEAATEPVRVEDFSWLQSAGDFYGDGTDCQVYATFREAELDTLTDDAMARFAAAPAPGGITRLPDTGRDATAPLVVGLLAIALGLSALAIDARAGRRPRHRVTL